MTRPPASRRGLFTLSASSPMGIKAAAYSTCNQPFCQHIIADKQAGRSCCGRDGSTVCRRALDQTAHLPIMTTFVHSTFNVSLKCVTQGQGIYQNQRVVNAKVENRVLATGAVIT